MTPISDLLRRLARPMIRAAAVLAGIATLGAALPATAEPALWVVRDEDSTIYLFGTVHMLRPNVAWKTPRIAKAMADSADLTLEVADISPDPATLGPLIRKYGIDMTTPLSAKLTEADRATLARIAPLYGLTPAKLESFRPWFAALTFAIMPVTKAGYDPTAGVDKLLKADAAARGEPVAGFETLEQQLAYFASLPPEVEVEYLRRAMEETETIVGQIDRLAAAWEAGDVKAIARILGKDLRAEAPRLYDLLITHRNRDFAAQIKTKLAGKGTSFVAVGAAHLAGPDSVQAQLKKLGIKAKRL